MNPVLNIVEENRGKFPAFFNIYLMILIVILNLFLGAELFSSILSPIARLSMMQIQG